MLKDSNKSISLIDWAALAESGRLQAIPEDGLMSIMSIHSRNERWPSKGQAPWLCSTIQYFQQHASFIQQNPPLDFEPALAGALVGPVDSTLMSIFPGSTRACVSPSITSVCSHDLSTGISIIWTAFIIRTANHTSGLKHGTKQQEHLVFKSDTSRQTEG